MSLRAGFTIFICSILIWSIAVSGCHEDPVLEVPPFIVTIEVDNRVVPPDQSVTLIAFAVDPDGDRIIYRWKVTLLDKDVTEDVIDPKINGNQRVKFTAKDTGEYLVEVTAEDDNDGESKGSFLISVTPLAWRDKRLAIIMPQNGETVSSDTKVIGTYYDRPEDKWIAVYVRRHGTNEWIWQSPVTVYVDGYWSVDAQVGGSDDSGISFDIGVKFVDIEDFKEELFKVTPDDRSFRFHNFHHTITVIRE